MTASDSPDSDPPASDSPDSDPPASDSSASNSPAFDSPTTETPPSDSPASAPTASETVNSDPTASDSSGSWALLDTVLLNRIWAVIPPWRTLVWVAVLINLQAVFVVAYYAMLGRFPTTPRYVIYGLIWVNVAVFVLWKARIPAGYDFETRRRALGIAAGYFAVLLFFAGLVATGVPERAVDMRIAWLPPGWGPAIVYAGESLTIILMPAYLLGYLALAKLVYVAVLEASGSVVAGIVGLFSCISCTLPIIAMIASAIFGGTGILAATALDASYDLSTAVFLLTVGLLYWRPGFTSLR